MDKEIVEKVARAAHLSLNEEELNKYSRDLSDILDYFKILDEAPNGYAMGVNPVEVADVLRLDEPRMEFDPDTLLSGMKTYDNYIRGPRLL
jgi:aspartyl-tRNA(Asn)/glutamyl-tRNA(Gln) amidotransferase subunit C